MIILAICNVKQFWRYLISQITCVRELFSSSDCANSGLYPCCYMETPLFNLILDITFMLFSQISKHLA